MKVASDSSLDIFPRAKLKIIQAINSVGIGANHKPKKKKKNESKQLTVN
jgi:hypothetical protein